MMTSKHSKNGRDTKPETLEAYLADLGAGNRSPLTIEGYGRILRALAQYLETQKIRKWAAVSPGMLREFLAARLGRGLKPSTVRIEATIVGCFFNWLIQEGIAKENPMSHVRRPKNPQRIRKTFTAAELKGMFAAIERTHDPIRNKAILSLLVDCGLRMAELLALTPANYDATNSLLTVKGKGSKIRTVSMGQQCKQAFEAHLEVVNGSLWGLHRPGLRRLLDSLGNRAGVHAYPHKFRHTFACRFLDAGGGLDELQVLLGHSCIASTMIYLGAGREERALRSHAAHSPLDALL